MPELPEIETLKRDLSQFVVGAVLVDGSVHHPRAIRAHSSYETFLDPLIGSRVVDIKRKGKFLSLAIKSDESGEFALVAHMGMSGQIRRYSKEEEIPKHSHVRFELSDGSRIVFVDPRTFGQMYLDRLDEDGFAQSLARLGVDPLNERELLAPALERFTNSSVGVKWLMLDQSAICGIGNMYADEILFRVGLRFDRPGASLEASKLAELASGIHDVLSEAVVLRGSSLKDLQYRDVNGKIGEYQLMHKAYGREGLECLRCGGVIERIFAKGRSSFLCCSCQT